MKMTSVLSFGKFI